MLTKEILDDLINTQKLSYERIGKLYNLSGNGIKKKAISWNILSLSRREILNQERQKEKEDLNNLINIQKLSYAEIGDKYGIQADCVKAKAKRFGIALPPKGTILQKDKDLDKSFSKEILEELLNVQKLSYAEIGRMYNMYGSSISKAAKRLGITVASKKVQSNHKCLICGTLIKAKQRYCSEGCKEIARLNRIKNKCNTKSNKTKHTKNKTSLIGKQCKNCDNLVYGKNRYCSAECRNTYLAKKVLEKQENYIKDWKEGKITGVSGKFNTSKRIRNYLFEKYNNKCCQCGWGEVNPRTNKIPLELEHIDGDCTNNKEDNLLLLCPNCHSLTPTYKSGNMGKSKRVRN